MGPEDLARAIALAAAAHALQIDKSGKPYVLHPVRVMQRVQRESWETQIVAVLHDVVEDTWVTLDMLRSMEFSDSVVAGVDAMSQRPGESYIDYVERCALDPIGAVVKLADLDDNCDPIRAWAGRDRAMEKYSRARVIIERALAQRQTA
jgi:(p)ppGpp synthase/HD superfamily hydrolase